MRIIAYIVFCVGALQAQESHPASRPTVDRARHALLDRGLDSSMRIDAARALRAARGKARKALPDLASALAATSDQALRFELICAIADILTGLHQSAYEWQSAPEATRADVTPKSYDEIIDGYAGSIISELRKALRDGDDETVWSAAVAIGRLGNEAAAAKTDLYSACRRAKGNALVNVVWAAAQLQSHSIDALDPMIAVLEGSEEAAKGHAASIIASLNGDGVDLSRAVPALAATLASKDRYAVDRAVAALGSIGALAAAAVPELLELAKTTADERLKIALVEALTAIDPKKNDDVPYLSSLLKSKDVLTQRIALNALGMGERLDRVPVEALMPVLLVTVDRWGAGGLKDFIAKFPRSPVLAKFFLSEARRSTGGRLSEWMPGLVAVGVDKKTRLRLLEEFLENDRDRQWKEIADALLAAGLEDSEVTEELERLSRHPNREIGAVALETMRRLRPHEAAEYTWKLIVERLDADARAESQPAKDDREAEYRSLDELSLLRELAVSKDGGRFVDRMADEFRRRNGSNRRRLFDALAAANPSAEATTAAFDTLIAASDPSDRACAIWGSSSLPVTADRIAKIEAMLGDSTETVRKTAFRVLIYMAPNSLRLRQAVVSDDPVFAEHRLESLMHLVESGDRSTEITQAVVGLLETNESYSFGYAIELMTRLVRSESPSSAPSAVAAAIDPPNDRRSRLKFAVKALGSRSIVIAEVARLAPWISWSDPNLTVVVLRAVRSVGRAGAPYLPAIQGLFAERDSVNRALETLPESARNGWYGLVLTEALETLSGLGSDAAAAAPQVAKFFSDRMPLPPIVERVLQRIAAEGRLRAALSVKAGTAPPQTTLSVDGADSVAPASETAVDGVGERRIVIAHSGAESGFWLEFTFFKDAGDQPAVEVAAFEFRTDSKPFVKSITLTEARIVMTDSAWFDLPTAGGAFAISADEKKWTGAFVYTTMPQRKTAEEKEDR